MTTGDLKRLRRPRSAQVRPDLPGEQHIRPGEGVNLSKFSRVFVRTIVPVASAAVLAIVPSVAIANTVEGTGTAQAAAPNPYLSWLPDQSQVDYAAWRERMAARSATRRSTVDSSAPVVRELEPPGTLGGNDTLAQAEPVRRF